MSGRGKLFKRLIPAGFLAVLAVTAWVEHALGRTLLGPDGDFALWEGNIWSAENSQRFLDPYSLTHVSHGIVFFGLLWLVARKLPLGARFMLATLLEASWEILENSPLIINRYREATIALGYTGDSILNSFSDIMMMATGFGLTAWVAPVIGVAILLVLELTCAMWFHDNLTLNVIMLVHPVESVKTWQLQDHPHVPER
jgi:hypothetical protein